MYGEVVSTTRLTPQLIRVVLGGGDLAEFSPSPYADSYVNILFEPAGASRQFPRRFTVRRWDAARRELTIDFAVHGDVGHAGRWAANAKPGDRLQFRGPAGAYSPHADVDRYLFVGDESAIPAIAACAEAVPTGRRVVIVAEVEDAAGELAFESPGELDVVWVHRDGSHDVASLLADAVRALPRFEGVVSAFVHGEAEATRSVRRALLEESIVDLEHLSCSPYWKRGYDDEQWRSIKADWVREMQAEVVAAR